MGDTAGRPKIMIYLSAGLKQWIEARAAKQGIPQTQLAATVLANYRDAIEHDVRPGATNWRLELARTEGRIRDLLSEWLDHALLMQQSPEVYTGEQLYDAINQMVMQAQDRLLRPYAGPQPLTAQMLITMARDLHALGGLYRGEHESPEYVRGLTDLLCEATGLPRETCERMLTV